MRAEIYNLNKEIKSSIKLLEKSINYEESKIRLEELEALASDPTLWENPEKAQKLMTEKNALEKNLNDFEEINNSLKEYLEFAELEEFEDECITQMTNLLEKAKKLELEALLSGELDKNNAFLEVHAGSGGTESCDWADMLLRMYTRWADAHNYKVEYLEETEGEVAGLKSATIKIIGHNAYGWLKAETGVHRLVRISPFDSNARRHTSFSSIGVYPEIDDSIEIEINEGDCRLDTYRASGAGGQHVNKTDSAVRITHLPTGIVVQCQNQRSQLQNREAAWKMLKARLYELELKKREDKAQENRDAQSENGWGHQIRSYVLQPYKMIKDLRTEAETSDAKGVLDGDIDIFLSASLAKGI